MSNPSPEPPPPLLAASESPERALAPAPAAPSVSVIVPTLNEAENIEEIIDKILAGGGLLKMEIIVVDDGSRDETQAIVRRLGKTLPVTLLARENPVDGLAGAVLAGARAANAGVVLVIDADGSHPPEKIPELALPVIRGERDMVIGSRYAPGGSTPGWSRKRRLMSRAASACAWPLTDVHDALSGYFAVRRELLASIPSDAAGFKIALEILVRGGDSLRVGEVPIAFRDRVLGQSKMGTRVILTYFRRLLGLSGWRESSDTVGLAMAKTALVWAADFAVFACAWYLKAGLSESNLVGFAAGAALNAWLKTTQSPRGATASGSFLSRLFFVSLLAFFLRSGLLATGANAFGWPALAAILPAIVIGWAVLFLGYALFIWPVREQYGSGVRWRVASMGATAYLLALRLAYLYALPVDHRLAVLPALGPLRIGGNWLAARLGHFGTEVFGATSAGLNLPALVCWAVGAWAVFKTAQHVFDKTIAFRALLLFSVLPVFFWPASVFSPDVVMLTVWALLLWPMSYALDRRQWVIPCAAVTILFWWPGVWLPSAPLEAGYSQLILVGLFVCGQAILVTPAGAIAVGERFARWSTDDRRLLNGAALFCAAVAGIRVFAGYLDGSMGLAASAVLWLPLLPLMAAEMQRPGAGVPRWWASVIYGCIIIYGFYFYWLTFGTPA